MEEGQPCRRHGRAEYATQLGWHAAAEPAAMHNTQQGKSPLQSQLFKLAKYFFFHGSLSLYAMHASGVFSCIEVFASFPTFQPVYPLTFEATHSHAGCEKIRRRDAGTVSVSRAILWISNDKTRPNNHGNGEHSKKRPPIRTIAQQG